MGTVERSSYVVDCELCEEKYESLLAIVKEYLSDLWEVSKVKLYGVPGSSQPQSQTFSPWLWI